MQRIRAIDLFCGAGGSSWGARLAGVEIAAGFDMWKPATDVYQDNFPEAEIYTERLEDHDLNNVASRLRKIDLILASPECTNHSPAKGNHHRCEKSKDTAFQITRFAAVLKPRWIVVENVVGMRNWSRYCEFTQALRDLGYQISEQVLSAADFGVPQKRRRLFILCDRKCKPKEVRPTTDKYKPVSPIICANGIYKFSPLRTKRRAQATIERAERAIAELGKKKPFLIVYYGSDHAGGWQRLDKPLRTITTLDRFAYVRPTKSGHEMRMLQVPELKAAMGMPKRFRFRHGTRRDRIKLTGNAVCPPVMRQVVSRLQATAK